jgi:hypothetical protein
MLPFFKDFIDYYYSTSYKQRLANDWLRGNPAAKTAGKQGGFNWPAAIFGPFWFAYRKMYIIAILIMFFEHFLSFMTFQSDVAFIFIYVGFSVVIGMNANYMYLWHLTKNLKKAKNEIDVSVIGGTNFLAVFVLISLSIFIAFIEVRGLIYFRVGLLYQHISKALKSN